MCARGIQKRCEVCRKPAAPLEHRTIPIKRQSRRVERVTRKQQSIRERGSPARLNELEVAILGRAVDFVPNHGVAGMGGVDADLVGAAGERFCLQQRKSAVAVFEFLEHTEFRDGHCAQRVDHSLEVDLGIPNLSPTNNRGINCKSLLRRMTDDDGKIGLLDYTLLHRDGRLARGG